LWPVPDEEIEPQRVRTLVLPTLLLIRGHDAISIRRRRSNLRVGRFLTFEGELVPDSSHDTCTTGHVDRANRSRTTDNATP
jgi:hypothetical protein